jgi:hypothetical protein
MVIMCESRGRLRIINPWRMHEGYGSCSVSVYVSCRATYYSLLVCILYISNAVL